MSECQNEILFMKPGFDFDKIKFATDKATFKKALELYEKGKVLQFEEEFDGFSAIVESTQLYNVSIGAKRFGHGDCDCYMGQNDHFCKHAVAVSLFAVLRGESLSGDQRKINVIACCSGEVGILNDAELISVKQSITLALKYIKSYAGPSRNWFVYQDSLSEGCGRLSDVVCKLPVSKQTSELLINLLLRLDKKLCTGGVDDSDGMVGDFVEEIVSVLEEYTKIDAACAQSFFKLKNRQTCFGWEDPLVKHLDLL